MDPKDVFESIVFKLDDIVEFVRFSFYDKAYQASTDFRDNGHKYIHWQSYDSKFGRCFTLSLDQELTKYGLEGIAFNISRKSTIKARREVSQRLLHYLQSLFCPYKAAVAGAGCSAGQCATALGFLQSSVKISPGVPSPSSRAQHGLRRPAPGRCLGRLQVGRYGLAGGPSPAVSPPPSTPRHSASPVTSAPSLQPSLGTSSLHSDLHTLHTRHQLKTVFTNFLSVESFKNISGAALTSPVKY